MMKDGITIIGLIIGFILIFISKRTKAGKYAKIAGILIIIACLFVAIPEFISGFMEGMTGSASTSSK